MDFIHIESPATCADLKGNVGSITNGNDSGTDIGDAEPVTPPVTPGGTTPPGGGTTPPVTPPAGGGIPSITTPSGLVRGQPRPYILDEYWSGSNFDNRDDTYYLMVGDYAVKTYVERDPDMGSHGRLTNYVTTLNLPTFRVTPTENIPHNFNTPENIANYGFSLSYAAVTYKVRDWWSDGNGNQGYKTFDGVAWIHTKNDAGKYTKFYLSFKGKRFHTAQQPTLSRQVESK